MIILLTAFIFFVIDVVALIPFLKKQYPNNTGKHKLIRLSVLWGIIYFQFIIVLGILQASPSSIWDYGRNNHPSKSIAESKEKKCFLTKLDINKKELVLGDMVLEPKEIWVEHANDYLFIIEAVPFIVEYPIINFHRNWYNVNMRFSLKQRPVDVSVPLKYFFVVEGEGGGYGWGFFDTTITINLGVDDIDWSELKIEMRKNWLEIEQIIKLSKL